MNKPDFLDFGETRTHAQDALNAMSRNAVPASPRNFEVWFAYAAKMSPELVAAIDQLIEGESGFTADVNADLHARFCEQDTDSGQARIITAELLDALRFMQDAIGDSELGQLDFYNRLEHYSEQLEGAKDASDIARTLEEIISDTAQAREQTGQLKVKLAESTRQVRDLNNRLETANKDAVTDPLTGIANRRYFETRFEEEVAEAEASNAPLSLMFLDIDHFKAFNDRHGHHTGDVVLRLVAEQIKSCVGERGMACRYGGEEFVVLLQDTDSHDALVMAEKIRIMIGRKEVTHRKSRKSFGRITISAGLTQFRAGEDSSVFLERADQLLYQAKEAGRNRVIQSTPQGEAAAE